VLLVRRWSLPVIVEWINQVLATICTYGLPERPGCRLNTCMRAIAIIATYNEERFIQGCLEHLFEQGIEVYLIDNQSTDATASIARQYLGSGLRGIEEFPRNGTYQWRQILRRKEELALELEADWFLHLDADETPLAPRPGQTLAEGLAEADENGFNVVQFLEFTFVPTRESPDHDHPDFRSTMRWYYPFAPNELHLIRGWKNRGAPVDLKGSGGHHAYFEGWNLCPDHFRLRHYLFLSHAQACAKYVGKTYDANEVREGWHGWRATITAEEIKLPSQSRLRMSLNGLDLDPANSHKAHCLFWSEP
jgi:glycosyltransferase involved in cell wall biosynthesis